MFSDPNDMVSAARSEQSPNMDYDKCRDIICTMATCHSLRVVDGELLGDPLDIKMFEFTGWTFEEGGNTQVEQQEHATGDTIIPSVARPPTGSHDFQKNQVRLLCSQILDNAQASYILILRSGSTRTWRSPLFRVRLTPSTH